MLCGILLSVSEDPIVEMSITLPANEMKKIRNKNNPAMTLVESVYVGGGGGLATGTRVPLSKSNNVITYCCWLQTLTA